MSTLRKWKVFIIVLLTLSVITPTVACATSDNTATEADNSETKSSWLDKIKGAGSSAAGWVKEKAPVVKEKAGEVWDAAKEKVGEASENFKAWNQAQEDEFWERTQNQLEVANFPTGEAVTETTMRNTEVTVIGDANIDAEGAEESFGWLRLIIMTVIVVAGAFAAIFIFNKFVDWYNDPER